jgi:hypothetical protein
LGAETNFSEREIDAEEKFVNIIWIGKGMSTLGYFKKDCGKVGIRAVGK